MSFIKAARETVFDPKHGGIRVVCERIGISEKVLRNKVDERNESNHLRLDEAFRTMLELKDYRIMHAMAYELGGTFDLLPDVDVDENEHIVTLLLGATSKHGQVCDVIHQALADGKITPDECKLAIAYVRNSISEQQKIIKALEGRLNP